MGKEKKKTKVVVTNKRVELFSLYHVQFIWKHFIPVSCYRKIGLVEKRTSEIFEHIYFQCVYTRTFFIYGEGLYF